MWLRGEKFNIQVNFKAEKRRPFRPCTWPMRWVQSPLHHFITPVSTGRQCLVALVVLLACTLTAPALSAAEA